MPEPDMRRTWPAFLAALDSGDASAIAAAFDDQQRAFAAAVLALDADVLTSNLADGFELHNQSDFFDWRDVYRGPAGMLDWATDIADSAGAFRFAAERIERAGNRFIVLGRMHASGRASELTAEFQWAQVWTLDGDRVARVDVYTDHDRALAAVAEAEA